MFRIIEKEIYLEIEGKARYEAKGICEERESERCQWMKCNERDKKR